MSEDFEKLQSMKNLIEALSHCVHKVKNIEASSHGNHKIKNDDLEEFKLNLAKELYAQHIETLNHTLMEMFGEDICDQVFTPKDSEKNNDCCECEPEKLSEFVKYLFETFDEKEVLFEVVAYLAEKISE